MFLEAILLVLSGFLFLLSVCLCGRAMSAVEETRELISSMTAIIFRADKIIKELSDKK